MIQHEHHGKGEVDEAPDGSESDNHECPICMEEFEVGDIVSWSTSRHCGHVFHATIFRFCLGIYHKLEVPSLWYVLKQFLHS